MKHLAPACFRAFACAGGACPDSCCRAGWEIVPDPDTLALYDTLPGPAGERIRSGIHPPRRDAQCAPETNPPRRGAQCAPAAEPLLRQNERRVCVLLDPDGLCCVQKAFGHGALCRICREYPRFHREFGGLTEHGLSLSCPTAYALATGSPLTWDAWEDDGPPALNDLDPERYLALRRGRDLALDLLGREDLPLPERIALTERLAAWVERGLGRRGKRDPALRLRRLLSLPGRERQKRYKFQFSTCSLQLSRFTGLEVLSPTWGRTLERLGEVLRSAGAHCAPLQGLLVPKNPEVYARYLAYSLYKYWMDALDDGDLRGRVARSVDMTLLGLALDDAFPGEGPFLQRISREIEHCEENLAALLENRFSNN